MRPPRAAGGARGSGGGRASGRLGDTAQSEAGLEGARRGEAGGGTLGLGVKPPQQGQRTAGGGAHEPGGAGPRQQGARLLQAWREPEAGAHAAASMGASGGAPMSERSMEAALKGTIARRAPRVTAPPKGPAPVGREEALALEAALARLLPSGAALALQARHAAAAAETGDGGGADPGAAPRRAGFVPAAGLAAGGAQAAAGAAGCVPLPAAASPALVEAFEAVAAGCAERGRVVEGLRLRYAELLNALALALACGDARAAAADRAAAAAHGAAAAAEARAAGAAADAEAARREATAAAAAAEGACAAEAARADEEASAAAALRRRVQALEAAVEELEERSAAERRDAEREQTRREADFDAELLAAGARGDDLAERLRFAERQARHYRESLAAALAARRPPGHDDATQTDAPPPPPEAPPPEPEAEPEPEWREAAAPEPEASEDEPPRDPWEELLRRAAAAKAARGRQWTVKTVGQLFADKAAADAAADAAGVPRAALGDFLRAWHLHKYGLRELADDSAVELLAAARHHAAAGCGPAYWLCAFTGMLARFGRRGASSGRGGGGASSGSEDANGEGAAEPGAAAPPAAAEGAAALPPAAAPPADAALLASGEALGFYLFCCCQVAYPSGPAALFPEADDAAPAVRAAAALDAARAVRLGEPDAAGAFVAGRMPAAAVDARSGGSGSGGGAGASVAAAGAGAGAGAFSAWGLLDLFMDEWLSRAHASAAALGSLFRAGCGEDGRAGWEEFCQMARVAAPGAQGGRRRGRAAAAGFVAALRAGGGGPWRGDAAREAARLAASCRAAAAAAAAEAADSQEVAAAGPGAGGEPESRGGAAAPEAGDGAVAAAAAAAAPGAGPEAGAPDAAPRGALQAREARLRALLSEGRDPVAAWLALQLLLGALGGGERQPQQRGGAQSSSAKMRAAHLLVCALAACSALAASAQIGRPPSAGDIDPLSFTLFSYLGNSLLWAAGNTIENSLPQQLQPTVGSFFADTQGRLAERLAEGAQQIADYGKTFQDDLATEITVQAADGDEEQEQDEQQQKSTDGVGAISNLCKIFNDYRANPVVATEPTPDPSVNALLASVCATAANGTAQARMGVLAEMPLRDAVNMAMSRARAAAASAAGAAAAAAPKPAAAKPATPKPAAAPKVQASAGPAAPAAPAIGLGSGALAQEFAQAALQTLLQQAFNAFTGAQAP
ncbi:MAG: hypothetical protein J3K34DRAFT_525073 [Monoraphidium minutum]|nr:MAG: hypothetical protein J3K34DRAFT_525073 [Monoraphidium minutum]